jgi:hypothetical protein
MTEVGERLSTGLSNVHRFQCDMLHIRPCDLAKLIFCESTYVYLGDWPHASATAILPQMLSQVVSAMMPARDVWRCAQSSPVDLGLSPQLRAHAAMLIKPLYHELCAGGAALSWHDIQSFRSSIYKTTSTKGEARVQILRRENGELRIIQASYAFFDSPVR